jgi:hypothetical protein
MVYQCAYSTTFYQKSSTKSSKRDSAVYIYNTLRLEVAGFV